MYDAELLRLAERDPHRPRYHFVPPAGWMNDPNGTCVRNGRVHLFYQHNPRGSWWERPHWGHASSRDMVRWRHHPIALAPDPNGPDADGAYSGCCVDDRGTPTIVYTGVWPETQCLATGSDDMLTWRKYEGNPVLGGPPSELAVEGFRDPWVWRADDGWRMIVGSGITDRGGAVLLYRCDDLRSWDYLGPLCVGDGGETGTMWECPSLIRVDDRDVLLFSPLPRGRCTLWQTGSYDGRSFAAGRTGVTVAGDRTYAAQPMRDAKGRWILWAWVMEARDAAQHGWAGTLAIPRVLGVDDASRLTLKPVAELADLRENHEHRENVHLSAGQELPLGQGKCLEIRMTIAPAGARSLRLRVLSSPDGREHVLVAWQVDEGKVVVDTTGASLDETVETGRFRADAETDAHGRLCLHVFVDRSVVEVFAGDRTNFVARAYPTLADSRDAELLCAGGSATLERLDVWDLRATH